jgi:bacterial/archaeal transporter family-2 protein
MEAFAVPFLLFVGALLAVQAAANIQLAASVGSPLGGAALQLSIGAALLVAVAAAVGTLGALELLVRAPVWHLIGGVASALYITAGILLFPRLGAVVAVGLFVAGQMLASLLLDGFGWLGVARDPIDAAAILGVAGVVIGTLLIVRAQTGGRFDEAVAGRTGWIALGVAAGAVLPVQGAINAQLRLDLDAPLTAGAWSFIVAALSMAAVVAAVVALSPAVPRPRRPDTSRLPWWGWLGGLCGATYVTSVFLLIPEIGVAATVALTIAGQQVASVLVDRYGLLRLPERPVPRLRLSGVALLLAGVALIQVA